MGAMLYRFYKVDSRGHVAGPPDAVDCIDDEDAIAKAKKLTNGHGVEVWDLARKVATIEAKK